MSLSDYDSYLKEQYEPKNSGRTLYLLDLQLQKSFPEVSFTFY